MRNFEKRNQIIKKEIKVKMKIITTIITRIYQHTQARNTAGRRNYAKYFLPCKQLCENSNPSKLFCLLNLIIILLSVFLVGWSNCLLGCLDSGMHIYVLH